MYFVRFGIFRIDAGVTDMWIGQCDNLVTVTWISQDFLISRQRGIEYHFTSGMPRRADGDAPENRSVLQCKNGEQPFIKGSNGYPSHEHLEPQGQLPQCENCDHGIETRV